MRHFFVGVDGGATKAVVRLEDEAGNLLGRVTGGPANIRLSVDKTWDAINTSLSQLLQSEGLSLSDESYQFHVGMGLAGCEVTSACDDFLARAHPFKTLVLSSDAHAACLGAHHGHDGAIIIVGTGVVGYQQYHGVISKVGGFGFPQDDEGGGAWIGLQAASLTLKSLDGRYKGSALTEKVYAGFNKHLDEFVSWLNEANSTQFATLAPLVVEAASAGVDDALNIMQRAAMAVDSVSNALLAAQKGKSILPCVLIGSVAPYLQPYLGDALRERLRTAKAMPDEGAIQLVREYLTKSRGT